MKFCPPSLAFCIVILCLAVPAAAQDGFHTVKKGETLYSIAKQAGVSLDALKRANGIVDPSKIRLGQKLAIPGGDGATQADAGTGDSAKSDPDQADSPIRYKVKAGDTLYSIARKHGVELKSLMAANRIEKGAALKIGQVLDIKSPDAGKELTAAIPKPTPAGPAAPAPTPSAAPDKLSENVMAGTSFQVTPLSQGAALNWPHPGERYVLNGKLPGILIKAQKGEAVKAVNAGKVVYSGPHSTFGHIVFVQSPDGYIYIYGGNESSPFKTGESVRTGDVIGTVGITPGIQEPQVYFSVWKDGSYVNPVTVLHG